MTDPTRHPAEAFHVRDFMHEEMQSRGWTIEDAVHRLDNEVDRLSIRILGALSDEQIKSVFVASDTADCLARIFGTDVEYWLNLDRSYRQYINGAKP